MQSYIRDRVMQTAEYIAHTGSTVRDTAKRFGISKSTVHKDMTEKLPVVSPILFEAVQTVMLTNKAERHIRGGNATKSKYNLRGAAQLRNKNRRYAAAFKDAGQN